MTDQDSSPDQYTEPENSTVNDWHGQEVDRDFDAAERAMARAGGDEEVAEELFEEERPEHPSEQFDVDPEQRSGTLTTDTGTDRTDD